MEYGTLNFSCNKKDYYFYGKKERKKKGIFYLSRGKANITIINEISLDRSSKITLPLIIPRCVFKSSGKDSIHHSLRIILQGSPCSSSASWT